MTKTIAIANQKGGVGKTTTCINLAASLVEIKKRVLLIDLDPQGNATMGSGVNKKELEYTCNDVLLETKTLSEVAVPTAARYDLIPGNPDLTVAEVSLLQQTEREQRLKKAIQQCQKPYDFILIDCPPSLNMLTLNALVAANTVLIPMQCEYYALEGLAGLMDTIEQVRSNLNPELKLEGLLRTMYDNRNRLCSDVSQQLLNHFGDKVYRTVVPRNVRLAEAPSFGMPALMYDKTSAGASAYLILAGEILRKQNQQTSVKEIEQSEAV